ncbi:hypothetical protein IWQ56_003946 [Coemansia nantahalensis]|nr:hypothetical protein IWQ56_003946 [Coemansia nantahalensis]
MGEGTVLKPFRVPETRLLAINELVAQVTLTYRTDEDEEMGYRYERDAQLQQLVQTAVVSLVNCGYTTGVARGPGFVLHQTRKKWPIGRRYIFTRHGEPLQSSLHKYFFQLELVDDERGDRPVLEITEVRGVALSVSSVAGSFIEGLDAVPLPPMAAIFGQDVPLDGADRRRSGSVVSAHSSYSAHRPRSPFYYEATGRPGSPSPLRSIREAAAMGGRTSRLSAYADPGDAGRAHNGPAGFSPTARIEAQRAPRGAGSSPAQPAEHIGSPEQSTVRTRSVSRSSAGSMQSVERLVENSAPARGERLGRTPWYRSLHGISPLSRQQKSLSSSDNEALLGAVPAGAGVSRIPRVAGASSAPRPVALPPASPGLGGLAHRMGRRILSPINMYRQRQPDNARPAPASAIPPSPQSVALPESVSIPVAVKNALLRRLKSPLSRLADKTASRLSVRERIAAFNNLSVDNDSARHALAAEAPALLTPVTHESPADDGGKAAVSAGARELAAPATRIPMPTTPLSAGRIRVGTSTGFVSVAASRPLSRASTNNGRAASPALSQISTVSARVQDAINALERASSGTTPRPAATRSGTKRAANGPVDSLTSPTKRPRAPSVAEDPRRNGVSRLNPLGVVNRLVRRNTDR